MIYNLQITWDLVRPRIASAGESAISTTTTGRNYPACGMGRRLRAAYSKVRLAARHDTVSRCDCGPNRRYPPPMPIASGGTSEALHQPAAIFVGKPLTPGGREREE